MAAMAFESARTFSADIVNKASGATGLIQFMPKTAEGLGTWTGERFNFAIDGARSVPKATALAVDNSGNLWGAGPRGVWRYDGQAFTRVGRAQGLPSEEFNDIAVDAQNRVWFANSEGLVLFDQAIRRE